MLRLLFLIIILNFLVFSGTTFASNEFSIDSVESTNDNISIIKITYLLDLPLTYNFKIGVSCDSSDYRLGNILNDSTGKYINYATGSWVDTPSFNITKDTQIELTNKVTDTSKCENAYLRVRAKIPDSTKYIDINYTGKIPIYTFLPTIIPTLLPTPLVTTQSSPIPTALLDEESKDTEITEINTLSKTEKEKIFISEFMPYPDGEEEWVEIENKNDKEIKLENWYIDDIYGSGGTPLIFSKSVEENNYIVVTINKSLLNNSFDAVTLLDEDKNIIHKVSYKKTIKGSSIQKNISDKKWYITKDVTKGKKNIDIQITSENVVSKLDKSSNNIIVTPQISTNPTPTINSINVLGINSYIDTDTKMPPSLKYFTIDEPNNHVYVISEKEMPSAFDAIQKFLEKLFW